VERHIRKISGVDGKTSLNAVLPRGILRELGITKGDFVEIHKENDGIIIKKLNTEKIDKKYADEPRGIKHLDRESKTDSPSSCQLEESMEL